MEVLYGTVLTPEFQAGVGGWGADSEGLPTQAPGWGLLQGLLSTSFFFLFFPQTTRMDGLLLSQSSVAQGPMNERTNE